MCLDGKLDFEEQIKGVFDKTSKTIGLLCKLCNSLLRPSLLQICKSFVRPHLDYCDSFYDKAAAQKLKILFITSFIVPTFQLHQILFSLKSPLLTDPLLIKMNYSNFNL